jgi:hypothetical protein
MQDPSSSAVVARTHARKAAVELGRVGLAARGLLYLLMGALALLAAANLQRVRGPKGTLAALIAYPAGRAVVLVLAMGFAAFAIAHLLALLIQRGMHWKAWWCRIVALFLAGTYGSLTWFAVNLAIYQVGNDEHATREHVGWLLAWPGGWIALGFIALGIAGFGGFELWRAVFRDPDPTFAGAGTMLRVLWRFGVAARGLVFVSLGLVLMRVSFDNDASHAGGMGAALRVFAGHAMARPALIVVGVGLAAFGVVEMVAARRGSGSKIVQRSAVAPTLVNS